jgi:hypothetical protein
MTVSSVCYCYCYCLSSFSHNGIKEHRLHVQVLRSIDEQCAIAVTAAMAVVYVAKDVYTWTGACYPLTKTLAAPVIVPPVHLLSYSSYVSAARRKDSDMLQHERVLEVQSYTKLVIEASESYYTSTTAVTLRLVQLVQR